MMVSMPVKEVISFTTSFNRMSELSKNDVAVTDALNVAPLRTKVSTVVLADEPPPFD